MPLPLSSFFLILTRSRGGSSSSVATMVDDARDSTLRSRSLLEVPSFLLRSSEADVDDAGGSSLLLPFDRDDVDALLFEVVLSLRVEGGRSKTGEVETAGEGSEVAASLRCEGRSSLRGRLSLPPTERCWSADGRLARGGAGRLVEEEESGAWRTLLRAAPVFCSGGGVGVGRASTDFFAVCRAGNGGAACGASPTTIAVLGSREEEGAGRNSAISMSAEG